jgi:hypothetical protein
VLLPFVPVPEASTAMSMWILPVGCLKKKAERVAPSLTPWQILDQLGRIELVEVWFVLRDGRTMCLPRITQPEPVNLCSDCSGRN